MEQFIFVFLLPCFFLAIPHALDESVLFCLLCLLSCRWQPVPWLVEGWGLRTNFLVFFFLQNDWKLPFLFWDCWLGVFCNAFFNLSRNIAAILSRVTGQRADRFHSYRKESRSRQWEGLHRCLRKKGWKFCAPHGCCVFHWVKFCKEAPRERYSNSSGFLCFPLALTIIHSFYWWWLSQSGTGWPLSSALCIGQEEN